LDIDKNNAFSYFEYDYQVMISKWNLVFKELFNILNHLECNIELKKIDIPKFS